jgi:hypothetical protein
MQRFLARKKVKTELRLTTRQGASLNSDFRLAGGVGTAGGAWGTGGLEVVENAGAKYFLSFGDRLKNARRNAGIAAWKGCATGILCGVLIYTAICRTIKVR